MAFKMKGSPMARNYGAPFNKKIGEDHTGEDHTNASHEAKADPNKVNQSDIDAGSKKSPSVGEVVVKAVTDKAKQIGAGIVSGKSNKTEEMRKIPNPGFTGGYNQEKTQQSKDVDELKKNLNKYKAYPQPGD